MTSSHEADHCLESPENVSFTFREIPDLGMGAISLSAIGGIYDGREAVVIKMPEAMSGFFPELSDPLKDTP